MNKVKLVLILFLFIANIHTAFAIEDGQIKKGDILIATELSRLGRNLLEVMGILQKCLEKDCQIWTLKENYRLGADIQSKVLAFAFSLASEIERQLISERTRLSLQRLKDEGKHLGRPYGTSYQGQTGLTGEVKSLIYKVGMEFYYE